MVGSLESDLTYVKIVPDYDVEISIGFLTSISSMLKFSLGPKEIFSLGYRPKNFFLSQPQPKEIFA